MTAYRLHLSSVVSFWTRKDAFWQFGSGAIVVEPDILETHSEAAMLFFQEAPLTNASNCVTKL